MPRKSYKNSSFNRKRIMYRIFSLILILFSLGAKAQSEWTQARQEIHDNPLLSASCYVAYIPPTEKLTPTPKGYEPFYLSHYGRHGSRWLIHDNQYTDVIDVLKRAKDQGKLTPRGEWLLQQLEGFYPSTVNRLGELTTVGERQHHDIGKRLTERFPEIFKAKNAEVDARSTVVIRCILSMEAECEELCKANRRLRIHNDVSESFQYYLNDPWTKELQAQTDERFARVPFDYKKEFIRPEHLWSVLFTDAAYNDSIVDREQMMRKTFDICGNMQSHDDGLDLYDLFSEEDCYNMWRCWNLEWYLYYCAEQAPMCQKNLLQNILATADTITGSRTFHGATMRFGHEVDVLPLAALLELGNSYPKVPVEGVDTLDRVWANYRIFPMGCNIQLVFYRPKKAGKGDILVKALLNEREVSLPIPTDHYPYYSWPSLRAYYLSKVQEK